MRPRKKGDHEGRVRVHRLRLPRLRPEGHRGDEWQVHNGQCDHSGNILWLENQEGVRRRGLFQVWPARPLGSGLRQFQQTSHESSSSSSPPPPPPSQAQEL